MALWFVKGQWFSHYTRVSSTNKTGCHKITEIFPKVTLNTIILTLTLKGNQNLKQRLCRGQILQMRLILQKTMFNSSLHPVICRRACVLKLLFILFVFVCVWWCPTHTCSVLCFYFVFLCLVCTMLPVSLNGPFLIIFLTKVDMCSINI